jgi:hypothetical protein
MGAPALHHFAALFVLSPQACSAASLSPSQSIIRGLWAATVVWLCMLLLLEMLLTSTARYWLRTSGYSSSFQFVPCGVWVALVSAGNCASEQRVML